ncbi:MAG TPA: hypothetical protein VG795_14780, partial [Acidimicrobiia bacterium]|nr:hypothetical protein [Acidimicrobiia bacterium]
GGIMARRPGTWPLVLSVVLVVVPLVSPFSPVTSVGAEENTDQTGNLLFLNVRGTADRQTGTAPERFAYVLEVYDATNKKIGTVTHDAAFTSATTAEIISTFKLPNGVLVNRAIEAFAPDSSRQNQFLTGIHPEGPTIQAAKGTGAYAGRTGRLRMSGWHETSKFPASLGANDFYAIELDPKP